jgi:putative oxidoreductase
MAKAAYQQVLTAGLNIYLLELVVLHLGGSLALLLNGPGRCFFDVGMGSELISGLDQGGAAPETDQPDGFGALTPAAISVKAFRQAD